MVIHNIREFLIYDNMENTEQLYIVTKELVMGPNWKYSVNDVLVIDDTRNLVVNTNNLQIPLHTALLDKFKSDAEVLPLDIELLMVDEYVQIYNLGQIKRMFANHNIIEFLESINDKSMGPHYINFKTRNVLNTKPKVYINRVEWALKAVVQTKCFHTASVKTIDLLRIAINDIMTKAQTDIDELLTIYENNK